jgi:biofilm PGA synthesis N-glycosyltransferase PgaC
MDTFLFWTALLLLGYLYVGYPVIAWLRARLRPRAHHRAPAEPSVTVVVVAHNEGDRIERRLENLLALDYPRNKLEIVIASDGSTDETVDRARRYQGAGVHVRVFVERRGKAAVLNDVVPSARGEIIVLADARQRFDPGAVRALVTNFADPDVGAVSGELMLTNRRTSAASGEGACLYWRYEKFIRRQESSAGSTVGVTGAIYAIRRALFEPIPPDTILDDVLIPLRVVRRGYRVLFEPGARAYDGVSATAREELGRKARTIAGTFQLFAREGWLLNPLRNRVWFETVSHKGLRLLAPGLQLAVLATSFGLPDLLLYRSMLAVQFLFYGAALGGYAFRPVRRPLRLMTVPYTICLMNWATMTGFVRFIGRRQRVTWDRFTSATVAPATTMRVPSGSRTRATTRVPS